MTPKGRAQLLVDEGFRLVVYNDVSGRPLGKASNGGKPTIGVGRNLVDRGITEAEAMYLFDNDLTEMWGRLIALLPWLRLDSTSSDIVLMVEFNTGDVFAFRKMLSAIEAGDMKTAAAELLDSEAARELPERYGRMAEALLTGAWP
jgi:lysozyme